MSNETRPPCWVTCGGDELGVCWGEPKCPDFWPGEAIAKRITELEAIADAADMLRRQAYGAQECFNPDEYIVQADDFMRLCQALDEEADHE